jgi:hypothetical protein
MRCRYCCDPLAFADEFARGAAGDLICNACCEKERDLDEVPQHASCPADRCTTSGAAVADGEGA